MAGRGVRWLGWALTVAFVGVAVVVLRDRWDQVQASGGLPGMLPVVAAVAVNFVANGVLVQAWREGVRMADVQLPYAIAARVWSASQLTRLGFAVAPVGARALLGRRHGVSAAIGAVTTLLEIAWLVALSPVLMLITLPAWAGDAPAWRWAGGLGVVPAAIAVAAVGWPNAVIRATRQLIERTPLRRFLGGDGLAAAETVRIERASAARWAALYIGNYALRLVAYLGIFASVGGDLPTDVGRAIGAFALGQFVGNIAILVPGGIGPREGATALVLAPAVGGGTALVVVATTRLAELVAELLLFGATRVAGRAEGDGVDPQPPATR